MAHNDPLIAIFLTAPAFDYVLGSKLRLDSKEVGIN
jgi:hypothetical protein